MAIRKQIVFDIDTDLAEKIYGKSYNNIYTKIRRRMEYYDFLHVEGTVYQSKNEMTYYEVAYIVQELIYDYQGLEKCIKDIRTADITAENDLNIYCDYDGTIGKYPDKTVIRRNRGSRER